MKAAARVLLAVALSVAGTAIQAGNEHENDPRHWLERMSAALNQMTYQGTFVYVLGDAIEVNPSAGQVTTSDGREVGANGKLPPVGSTVDLSIPSYTNTIGSPELGAVWTDPDFDPSERAFYYARVIEIPTPRWTAYDAVKFKLELPGDVPLTLQERAYSSPIWYTPATK